MKLCVFRTVPLSIIRILFTVHSAMVCVIQACRTEFHPGPARKAVWHIPLLSVQWINCWWWTEGLSKTCRVSCQNKFVKLVHLVGFIIKKFVMTHGQTDIKFSWAFSCLKSWGRSNLIYHHRGVAIHQVLQSTPLDRHRLLHQANLSRNVCGRVQIFDHKR
jgi:hypothetical protein